MQHAPVVNQECVARSCEGDRQGLALGELLFDALAGDVANPARRLKEHVIPPKAIAVIGGFAQAQQCDSSISRAARFEDGACQNVQRYSVEYGLTI